MVKTKFRSKMKMLTARRVVTDSYVPLLAVLFAALSANLLGQTYDQVAPKPVPEKAPAVAAEPAPPPATAASAADPHEVLVANLTGIRLVPTPEAVEKGGVRSTNALDADQLPWLQRWRLSTLAEQYVGHPLTREGLANLVRDLVVVSRESDRPVVDVFAPPQDVSSGAIQIVVMAAKLGELRVENNKYFDT